MMGPVEILGIFLLGILAGILIFRELIRWASQFRAGNGPCDLCQTIAYLVVCRRCGRSVAMCCYIQVHGTDDPGPHHFRKRRGISVCVRCLLPDEKELLERMVG